MQIEPYILKEIEFLPYDEVLERVAEQIMEIIRAAIPSATPEHIGSTGARIAGKNSINIIIPSDLDHYPSRLRGLGDLGFQESPLGKPEPATRPLRVGTVRRAERPHNIHVHLVVEYSDDYYNAIFFREYLKSHPEAAAEYVQIKKAAVEAGRRDAISYNQAKEPFIKSILQIREQLLDRSHHSS